MITLNETSGSATANSYVSLVEADDYMEAHIQAADWSALDDERKKAALVAATRELDSFQYAGRRATQSQSLSWPRTGITDHDGYAVTGIPRRLKYAQIELAIYRLTEDERTASDFELENLESVSIGPLTYAIRAGAKGLPGSVKVNLEAIGPGATTSKSARVMVL